MGEINTAIFKLKEQFKKKVIGVSQSFYAGTQVKKQPRSSYLFFKKSTGMVDKPTVGLNTPRHFIKGEEIIS